jgi:hypothetical protein
MCCVLASCGVSTKKSFITREDPIDPNKTIVVGRPRGIWSKLDENYGTGNELRYDFKATVLTGLNGQHVHMIEPGTYTLEYIEFFHSPSIKSVFDKLGKQKLATFEVKPGEVIYTGTVKPDLYEKSWHSSWELHLKVIDDFEKAKAVLMKERPDISVNLLKKRLMTIRPDVQAK